MNPEIRKQMNQILRFIDDEYSFFEHLKIDPNKKFGLLRSLSRKELKEYFSWMNSKQD